MLFKRYFRLLVSLLILFSLHAFAIESGQYDIDENIEVANRYMQQKQWDFAIYEWRNILKQDPINIHGHLGLSQSLIKAGFPNDAIKHLEELPASAKNPLLDIVLARAYTNIGNIPKAAQIFQDLLSKNPDDPKVFTELKNILPKLTGEKRASIEKFLLEQLQQAKPKAKDAIKAGDYAKAVRYYEILSTFKPTDSMINDYALTLFLAGKRAAATEKLMQLSNKSNCEIKANSAIMLLSTGKSLEARNLMEDTIGICSDFKLKPSLYNNLGYIYEANRLWTRAQFAYERAIELNPAFTKAGMNLAYVYQRNKNFKRAVNVYKAILAYESNNAKVWNQLGFTYELLNDFKGAMAAYKKAIALDPALKDAYYNLGILYKKEDKLEDSDLIFKKMADIEFSQMENSDPSGNSVAVKPAIFDYVDLFFSDSPF